MISYREVPQILSDEFPEIQSEVNTPECFGSVYMQLTRFAAFTNKLVEQRNFPMVKKCFALAETFYRQGDRILANAIENVYVYSLHLDFNRSLYRVIQPLLPESLSRCHRSQIQACFP